MKKLIRTVTAKDGGVAELKQHGRNIYSLTIVSRRTGHNRWGTLAEIEQDGRHFIAIGKLPTSGKRMW